MEDIEKLLTQLPKFAARPEFKEALKKRIFATDQERVIDEGFVTSKASPGLQHYFFRGFVPRFAFLLVVLSIVVGGLYYFQKSTGTNVLRPAKVMAAEIIRRSKETFIKPGTIYHHRIKHYSKGATEPTVYELWEDMDTQRFRNHVVYPPTSTTGASEVWQWFDLDAQWDVNVPEKKVQKDRYIYSSPDERMEKKGHRVDIAHEFDTLLSDGILEAKEGRLDTREVYVVYDTRPEPEKSWDILTFDRQTFQLLRTEKYTGEGNDRKLQLLVEYEVQESLPKTDQSVKELFVDQPLSLGGFTVTERTFVTSQGYLDDGFQDTSGSVQSDEKNEREVKNLVATFEKYIQSRDVEALMALFTPPATEEESESYRSLVGIEPKSDVPRLFNNVSTNFIVTSWGIAKGPDGRELVVKENDTYFVTVEETRKSWCNAGPCAGTYSFENTSLYVYEIVKDDAQWKVNSYVFLPASPHTVTKKYDGFGL